MGVFSDIGEALGFGNTKKVNKANRALESIKNDLMASSQKNEGYIGDYNSLLDSLYGNSVTNYDDVLNKYINSDAFNYKGDVEDFASPAIERRIKTALDNITKSNANAGNMFSSDYLNQLNAKSQAIASEEWDKAYDRYMQDKAMQLQEYNTNQSKMANIASMLGQNVNAYSNNMGSVYTNLINNNNALTQGLADINSSIAQNNLNKKTTAQALLNPFRIIHSGNK